VPRPEAPYPQDYIIDQQGIVCYWSDEYDPQKIIKIIDRLLLSVEEEKPIILSSRKFELDVSPNPAKNRIVLRVNGVSDKNASIKIYDVTGKMVKYFSLESSYCQRPSEITWNGHDNSGQLLPAGIYFARLETGQNVQTRIFILIK